MTTLTWVVAIGFLGYLIFRTAQAWADLRRLGGFGIAGVGLLWLCLLVEAASLFWQLPEVPWAGFVIGGLGLAALLRALTHRPRPAKAQREPGPTGTPET